jgi:hypothetical protein
MSHHVGMMHAQYAVMLLAKMLRWDEMKEVSYKALRWVSACCSSAIASRCLRDGGQPSTAGSTTYFIFTSSFARAACATWTSSISCFTPVLSITMIISTQCSISIHAVTMPHPTQ